MLPALAAILNCTHFRTCAFGACVYLRSVDDSGCIYSQLLCSKSRIGPLIATSIARLELQGAVLMVELVTRLLQLLTVKINKVRYYTDSTTVLAWIRSPSYTWETYVANRVAKIQANTDIQQWNYIKGSVNPADMVSRGMGLQTLLKTPAWFNGPDFLSEDESLWEAMQHVIPEDVPERRKKKSVLAATTVSNEILVEEVNHKNSFFTLQKIFAYCFRFYSNCRKNKSLRNIGQLTVDELHRGTNFIWVCVQRREFPDDYRSLQRNANVHKGSNIASLSPFFDEKTKLIRVGGRLKNSSIVVDAKHQISLPIPTETNTVNGPENLKTNSQITKGTFQTNCLEKPTPKRKKIVTSLLSIALMVCLSFPSSIAQKTDRVKINPLDEAVGIYFEDIGKIQTINSYWNIYVYYNLTAYFLELREIESCLQRIEEFCAQENIHKVNCKPTIDAITHRFTAINHNNEILYNYNMGGQERTRVVRSPLDIVGKVANSLFGVLDQDDAKHIESQIYKAKQNQQHLMELIQKQSSIADSTSNLLKRSVIQINQQSQALNAYLAKIANAIQEKQVENDVKQNIASLTSYLILAISNLEKIQELLLDVLLDLNHARINPQIITPHQLTEQIMLIKAYLPPTLTPAKGSTMDLYKMASVKGRVLKEAVVFEMRLPLANSAEFQLFNLLPIPILQQSYSYLVETSSQLLAISPTRDEFFLLSEFELSLCKELSSQHFLCKKVHPTYTKQAATSSCEIALLNHKNNALHECTLKKIPDGDYWKALKGSNRWIFSTRSRVTGHLICNEITEGLTVVGNGLLEFKEPCMLKMPTMSIRGILEYNNTVTIKNSFIPNTNISTWILKPSKPSTSDLPQIHDIDEVEFVKLKDQINTVIQQSEELPEKINWHDYHHYGLGYLLLAGMIGAVVIYCCHRRRKPKPAPRSSRFQVNV